MRIQLNGFVDVEGLRDGKPGQQITVTDENREVCELLLRLKSAYRLPDDAAADATARTSEVVDDDDNESDSDVDELGPDDEVAQLLQFGVHPRYIKALQDAELGTIAAVQAVEDLTTVSGIGDAAAKKIREILTQELDPVQPAEPV